jgi:hypothetical protein
MTSYINQYFNVQIDFPENWSWRSQASNDKSKIQFQSKDDDLPTNEGEFRTLVTAIRKGRGEHNLIAAQFFMGIHKQSNMHEAGELESKDSAVNLSYGEMPIVGKQARFMSAAWRRERFLRYSKTITYEIKPHIWLNIHINGESPEAFQAAQQLLGKIVSISPET